MSYDNYNVKPDEKFYQKIRHKFLINECYILEF